MSLQFNGYSEPVPGGWAIDATWSSNATPNPMTEEFVDAMFLGGTYIRVEVDPARDHRATLAVQSRTPDDEATVRAFFPGIEAELRLDSEEAGLAVLVTRDQDRSLPNLARVHLGMHRNGIDEAPLWSFDATTSKFGELRLTARNARLRHLSVYAEFFDVDGNALEPGPLTDLPSGPARVFDNHATKRFVYCLGPIDTVFGIPLCPNPVTMRIPFPENAATMRLYWGGLGTGRYDSSVCALGIAATAIFEFGLPVFMLLAGAAVQHTGIINKLMQNKVILLSIYPVALGLIGLRVRRGRHVGPARADHRRHRAIAFLLRLREHAQFRSRGHDPARSGIQTISRSSRPDARADRVRHRR